MARETGSLGKRVSRKTLEADDAGSIPVRVAIPSLVVSRA